MLQGVTVIWTPNMCTVFPLIINLGTIMWDRKHHHMTDHAHKSYLVGLFMQAGQLTKCINFSTALTMLCLVHYNSGIQLIWYNYRI